MKPNPVNPSDQAVIIATESDLINQALAGSPRTSRKFNNKFLEVNLAVNFLHPLPKEKKSYKLVQSLRVYNLFNIKKYGKDTKVI